jgi:hypothetical protein
MRRVGSKIKRLEERPRRQASDERDPCLYAALERVAEMWHGNGDVAVIASVSPRSQMGP